jgi:hypothetical protein
MFNVFVYFRIVICLQLLVRLYSVFVFRLLLTLAATDVLPW